MKRRYLFNSYLQLLYSKLLSGLWPNFDSVAKRCEGLYVDFKEGHDIQKFVTTGTEDKKFSQTKSKKATSGISPNRSPDAAMNQPVKQANFAAAATATSQASKP